MCAWQENYSATHLARIFASAAKEAEALAILRAGFKSLRENYTNQALLGVLLIFLERLCGKREVVHQEPLSHSSQRTA